MARQRLAVDRIITVYPQLKWYQLEFVLGTTQYRLRVVFDSDV